MLERLLAEICDPSGVIALDRFTSLREVDAKVREAKHILPNVKELPANFVEELSQNQDFQAQSRRVRLEALREYLRSAIKFIDSGGLGSHAPTISKAPDVSKLTSPMPTLKGSIDRRWIEAQRCVHAECYTATIVMMGSILEALLLARATLSSGIAYQSSRAPKNKNGQAVAIQDWTLSSLIDVAVDVGWIKSDRGKFGHALREARNVVHPWVEVTMRANFDEATCKTSWEVLKASIDDMLRSCP